MGSSESLIELFTDSERVWIAEHADFIRSSMGDSHRPVTGEYTETKPRLGAESPSRNDKLNNLANEFEKVLFRRALEKKLDGYTLEASQELARIAKQHESAHPHEEIMGFDDASVKEKLSELTENIYCWRQGDEEPMHGMFMECDDPANPGVKYVRADQKGKISDNEDEWLKKYSIIYHR